MDKKYELIETVYRFFYRIKALKDFQLITGEIVKKGDLGGVVNGEHNLSQEGNCWIEFEARAFDNSTVSGNAVMKGNSWAKDNSIVSGNAVMKDHSCAKGDSRISGNVIMKDNSIAFDNSTVSGNAVMKDYSCADGNSIITGNAILQEDQCIKYGTVTTDLFGTKDWAGALYAELGVKPENNKIVLYKSVWSTYDESVFKSNYDRNFLYKIGETVVAEDVDEDIFKSCTNGLHFTSLEFVNCYRGDTILECEVEVPDIVTVQASKVRARKCRVLRVYKEE